MLFATPSLALSQDKEWPPDWLEGLWIVDREEAVEVKGFILEASQAFIFADGHCFWGYGNNILGCRLDAVSEKQDVQLLLFERTWDESLAKLKSSLKRKEDWLELSVTVPSVGQNKRFRIRYHLRRADDEEHIDMLNALSQSDTLTEPKAEELLKAWLKRAKESHLAKLAKESQPK